MMNKDRCELLKLVPNSFNWKIGFLQSLRSQSSKVARNLYQKMTDSDLTAAVYQTTISQWVQQATQKLGQGDMDRYFKQLIINRQSIFDSEISKNPRGQILEPGFRVIFPRSQLNPGSLVLVNGSERP
jgi:predicted enzyme involved in methoxymalonyl-ACP biosynthesis